MFDNIETRRAMVQSVKVVMAKDGLAEDDKLVVALVNAVVEHLPSEYGLEKMEPAVLSSLDEARDYQLQWRNGVLCYGRETRRQEVIVDLSEIK